MFTRTNVDSLIILSLIVAMPITSSASSVRPQYPQAALDNCIEDSVSLRYEVDEQHHPSNIEILCAEPEGVFEQATKKYLAPWYVQDEPGTITETVFERKIEDIDDCER